MKQWRDVQVRQDGLNNVRGSSHTPTAPFIAKIIQTYSERMTCDIQTTDGQEIYNVPVLTKGGLVDGEPYGEVCLPVIDDYVIVMYGSYGTRHKIIIGTIFPYLSNEMLKDVVNSGGKQFTKKLFEEGKPKSHRRVFPSGTSVEVDDEGYVTVELPNGTYIKVDEDLTIEDHHGNIVTLDSSGMNLTDANGNTVTLDSSGMNLSDANGNTVVMGTTSVLINGNLEVLQ